MAKQLEYKVERLNPDVSTLTESLNHEGAEGWELVTVVEADGENVGRSLVFRREQANPTWDQPEG
jgi:hypothetical protein